MVIFCEFKATVVRSSFYDEHLSNSRKQNYSCFGLKKKKKKKAQAGFVFIILFCLCPPKISFAKVGTMITHSEREIRFFF